jgi:hypothetical protein
MGFPTQGKCGPSVKDGTMAIQGKDSLVGEGGHAAFFAAVGVNLAAWWSIPEWSPTVPDAVHSLPIQFKGGTIYFIQPWLAKMARDTNGLPAGLGAVCVVLLWVHRDELERLR